MSCRFFVSLRQNFRDDNFLITFLSARLKKSLGELPMRKLLSLIVVMFGFNLSAHAQTYVFTGDVVYDRESQSEAFNNVTTFTATLTFDITQAPEDALYSTYDAPSDGDTTFYGYTNLSYQIGSHTWSYHSDFNDLGSYLNASVAVLDSGPLGSFDLLGIIAQDAIYLNNGQYIQSSTLLAIDTNTNYFSETNAYNLLSFNNLPDRYGYIETYSGDIRLYGITMTAQVPEPATWLMMLIGFGMVASVHRRKRRVIAPQAIKGAL